MRTEVNQSNLGRHSGALVRYAASRLAIKASGQALPCAVSPEKSPQASEKSQNRLGNLGWRGGGPAGGQRDAPVPGAPRGLREPLFDGPWRRGVSWELQQPLVRPDRRVSRYGLLPTKGPLRVEPASGPSE